MALCREQIEHLNVRSQGKKSRKWLKNQFNRYIRRIPIDEVVNVKEKKGWEF